MYCIFYTMYSLEIFQEETSRQAVTCFGNTKSNLDNDIEMNSGESKMKELARTLCNPENREMRGSSWAVREHDSSHIGLSMPESKITRFLPLKQKKNFDRRGIRDRYGDMFPHTNHTESDLRIQMLKNTIHHYITLGRYWVVHSQKRSPSIFWGHTSWKIPGFFSAKILVSSQAFH